MTDKRDVKHYAVPEWADTLAIGSGESIPIVVVKAAPMLLKALVDMFENEDAALHGQRLIHPHKATMDKARAAIAQAKGQA